MVRSKGVAPRTSRQGAEERRTRRLEFGLPQLTSTPMPTPSNNNTVARPDRAVSNSRIATSEPSRTRSPERSANVPTSTSALQRNQSGVSRGSGRQNVSSRAGSSATRTRQRRYRPGTRALMEIRKFQKSTDLLIRKLPFSRVVRDIARETLSRHHMEEFRWQAVAITCLQEAAEAFLVQMFANAQQCAIHGQRKTVMLRDLWLLQSLKLI